MFSDDMIRELKLERQKAINEMDRIINPQFYKEQSIGNRKQRREFIKNKKKRRK